ncbi:MAG: PH domain-containing protein [Acidimicrobiia bacterium]|jgi:uncharacterized membrane protein YdbT with pleckstrin-like domain
MPYPRRLIGEGETVVLDLKPHWWFFVREIVAGALLLVLVIFLVATFEGGLQSGALVIMAIATLAWAGWLLIDYMNWQNTHFVVTDKRVIYRTGVVAKRGVEIPLARVNNINFHQGLVDRLVGAGSLEIESAGTDGESRFSNVRHPDSVQQEIYRAMEVDERNRAAWGRQGPTAEAAPAQNIPDQLQQLADLRDKGVISAAEFEAKKTQLLERM